MLRIFKEVSCTNELLEPEGFSLADSVVGSGGCNYVLTAMTGAQVYQVYKLSGGSYTKLATPAGYSIASNVVQLAEGLLSDERLIVIPTLRLEMLFGGGSGSEVTTHAAVWLKRDPTWIYGSIVVSSEDLAEPYETPTVAEDQTFANGTSSAGFTGLGTNALVGYAVTVNDVYVGTVTGNTATQIAISDENYTNSLPSRITVFKIGGLEFALDNNGAPGTYAPVINVPDIDNDTPVKIWVSDTYTIPGSATNYPNHAIRVQTKEYVE